MIKRHLLVPERSLRFAAALVLLILLAIAAQLNRPGPPLQSPSVLDATQLTINHADRVLILAPHPDDETIGCGGVIQEALKVGAAVRVVFLTNGDANETSFVLYAKRLEMLPRQVEAMGLVRHDEALAAARVLGLQPEQLTFLGYPDFGMLGIWTMHWGAQPPLRSMLTRVTAVPYASAYRPGAAYKGEEVLADLEAVLRDFRPTKVFLSHPADHNPDHLALYAFTRVALFDMGMAPQLYPYLVHAPHWPEPHGQAPGSALTPPTSLATSVAWWTLPLNDTEIDRKLKAMEAHRSQFQANPHYLPSFIRANELFGDYPDTVLLAESVDVGLDAAQPGTEAPEQLTDAEQAKFVGLEWHTVRREGNDLVLSVALTRPLANGVALSAFLFGYRTNEPFADMPKIHVKIGELSHSVYDQELELGNAGVEVRRDAHNIVMRIPLALLADPDRALVYARTYLGDLALDSAAWRVLDLKAN